MKKLELIKKGKYVNIAHKSLRMYYPKRICEVSPASEIISQLEIDSLSSNTYIQKQNSQDQYSFQYKLRQTGYPRIRSHQQQKINRDKISYEASSVCDLQQPNQCDKQNDKIKYSTKNYSDDIKAQKSFSLNQVQPINKQQEKSTIQQIRKWKLDQKCKSQISYNENAKLQNNGQSVSQFQSISDSQQSLMANIQNQNFDLLLKIVTLTQTIQQYQIKQQELQRKINKLQKQIISSRKNYESKQIQTQFQMQDKSTIKVQQKDRNEQEIQRRNISRSLTKSALFPYSAIGLIQSCFSGQNVYGSAFLIWHNIALTAAHNIYRKQRFCYKITFSLLGSITNQKPNEIEAACVFIPNQYLNIQTSKEYDFAIIILNTNEALARQYGKINLECTQIKQDQQIKVIGFASRQCQVDVDSEKNIGLEQFALYEKVSRIDKINERILHHNIGSSYGQSGSPILRVIDVKKQVRYQIVGIHTGGSIQQSHGILINNTVKDRIYYWCHFIHDENPQKYTMRTQTQIPFQILQERFFKSQVIQHDSNMPNKNSSNFRLTQLQIQNPHFLFQIGESLRTKKSNQIEAIKYFQRALKIYQSNQGQKNLFSVKVFNSMGIVQATCHNYNKAIKCFTSASQILEQTNNKNSNYYACVISNIGAVYLHQKQYRKAKKRFQLALEIKQKSAEVNKSKSPELYNLGVVQFLLNFQQQSKQLLKQAINQCQMSIQNNMNKKKKCTQATYILVNMGLLLLQMKQYENAIQTLEKANKIAQQYSIELTLQFNYKSFEKKIDFVRRKSSQQNALLNSNQSKLKLSKYSVRSETNKQNSQSYMEMIIIFQKIQ